MNKSIIITRPNCSQSTRYVFYWAKEIIDLAKEKGIDVFDLKVERANDKEFLKAMKNNPSLVIFNGGGNMKKVLGFNNEVLIDKDSICLFTRETTRMFGVRNNETGAIAYVGHDDSYVFCCSPANNYNPLDDKLAHLFLDPVNCFSHSLLNGLTVGEAALKVKEEYEKNIKEVKNNPEYEFALPYLIWNMNHFKVIGDKEAKI